MKRVKLFLLLPLFFSIAACGGMDAAPTTLPPPPNVGTPGGGGVTGGESLGATPGGAQDFRFVRETIAQGGVPPADAFFVEGLLSEHDLPLEGEACDEPLCLSMAAGAVGREPRKALVQVGFSSGLSAETFQRPALNLALVVDVSGSMAGGKMEATRQALKRLSEKLGADDRISIVAFNDRARLLLAPTAGDDRSAIHGAIEALAAGGSTNMEGGIALGLEQIRRQAVGDALSARLMLFTDAMPNVGLTSPTSFVGLLQSAADQGVGLTAFGLGLDFSYELVDMIANLRGGNYVYLADATAIREVFDQDFDYLVTPLAYGLKLALTIQPGFRVKSAYGVKAWSADTSTTSMVVETVFISKNKGAMLVELERTTDAPLVPGQVPILAGSLRYETPAGISVEGMLDASLDASALMATESVFPQPGLRKAAALVSQVRGMQTACSLYHGGDTAGAQEVLHGLVALMERARSLLADDALDAEIALVQQLSDNM